MESLPVYEDMLDLEILDDKGSLPTQKRQAETALCDEALEHAAAATELQARENSALHAF
jgi:hypothetical protein